MHTRYQSLLALQKTLKYAAPRGIEKASDESKNSESRRTETGPRIELSHEMNAQNVHHVVLVLVALRLVVVVLVAVALPLRFGALLLLVVVIHRRMSCVFNLEKFSRNS